MLPVFVKAPVCRARSVGYGHLRGIKVCTLNVTSLEKHFHEVTAYSYDVFLLQEVRVSRAAQQRITKMARQQGYQMVWGHHTESIVTRKSGLVHASVSQGGVAVMCKVQFSCKELVPAEPDAKILYKQGRFVHAGISIGRGDRLLHLISFYGVSGCTGKGRINTDYVANERFLGHIFEFVKTLGDAPCVVGMDANTQVSDSEVMTQTLFANEFFDLSGPAGRQDCTYCANG